MQRYKSYAAFMLLALAMPAISDEKGGCASVDACLELAPEAAGPALLGFLQHEDWDSRVHAAYALGSIGYKNAVPDLIKALSNEADWQLVYAAIISLSRLQDPSAQRPIWEVSRSYWYPFVRAAAACGDKFLKDAKKPCAGHADILGIDVHEIANIGADYGNCIKPTYRKLKEPADMKKYGGQSSFDALKEFKHMAPCETDEAGKSKEDCAFRTPLYPKVAARITDGWLTGRDQGELGGELMFFPDKGEPYEILEDNIEDIYIMNEGVIAVAGFAHLTVNDGMIYALKQDAAGKWQATPFVRLPGAPHSSYKTSAKEVLINAYGGTVIFNERGNIKMAACK